MDSHPDMGGEDDGHMVSKEMRFNQMKLAAHISNVLAKHMVGAGGGHKEEDEGGAQQEEKVATNDKRKKSSATGLRKESSATTTRATRKSTVTIKDTTPSSSTTPPASADNKSPGRQNQSGKPTRFHQDLLDRKKRFNESVTTRSESSMSTQSMLPRLTPQEGLADVREKTRGKGVGVVPLGGGGDRGSTPSIYGSQQRSRGASGGPRSVSALSNATSSTPSAVRTSSQGRPPSPGGTTNASGIVIHPGSKMTFSPKRRTKCDVERAKFQAGCGMLTQLDRAGENFTILSQYSERHNDAARRRYQQEQLDAAQKLQDFYVHEDLRENALDNKVNRENEGRVRKWLEVLAVFGRGNAFLQKLKENRANRVLCGLFQIRFIAHIQRRRAKVRRQNALKERQEMMLNRPTKAQFRRMPSMRSLADSSLQLLIDSLEKECFIQGEWLAKEGSVGSCCYILHRGCLDMVKSTKKQSTQGRSTSSGVTEDERALEYSGCASSALGARVKVLSTVKEEGHPIGESYLLIEEDHDCGIYAKEDTDVWILTRKVFQEVIDSLPSSQSEPIHRQMDERRERNMVSNSSLSESFVRKSSKLFSLWTDVGIRRILEVAKPSIYRKGDVIVPKGQYGKTIIFVVSGKVEVSSDGKKVDIVREGHALGELVAGRNLKDRSTALKAVTICDCWLLSKGDFTELFCHENPMAVVPAMMTMVDESGKERGLTSGSRH